jgi:hypothetical protein
MKSKTKGLLLELKVAKSIRRKGLDKNAKRMPRSGAFPHFREDIYTVLPLHIECKNQEKVHLWEWWDEARYRAIYSKNPVLVIGGDNRPLLAVVDLDFLLNLLLTEKQYIEDIK